MKQNLIVVSGFASNSILLKGLIEFLSECFNVRFIDLPGFTRKVPPLKKINMDNYSKFVEDKIKEFNLKEYWIVGISFGFAIISNIKLNDNNCKGIIALEPYINNRSINKCLEEKKKYTIFLDGLVCRFKLYKFIWRNRYFRKHLAIIGHIPSGIVHTVLTEIDPRTFFETARLILKFDKNIHLHNLPYALLINKNDQTVDAAYLIKVFRNSKKELILDDLKMEHYPQDLSREYFERVFPKEDLKKLLDFMRENSS